MKRADSRFRSWVLPFAGLLLAPLAASAHPMGNFTVSHYAGFKVSSEGLQLHYALDFAEIPAFQERQAMGANHDGRVTPVEEAAYLKRSVPTLLKNLSIDMDGRPATPTVTGRRLIWTPGAGGLPTMRLELEATVPVSRSGAAGRCHTVRYQDGNLPERTGWKEIVVRAADGGKVRDSTAPAIDRSHALTAYPQNQISSPPQDLSAQFRFVVTASHLVASRGMKAANGTEESPPGSSGLSRDDMLTRLIHRRSFPIAFLPLALLIAFGLGCFHALSPGHGKTVVGAYLVGSRGTAWHAVLLGLTVTISHTIGVFALGLAVMWASRWIVPERLYPWLGFSSGAAIIAIGLGLLTSRLKGLAEHRHAPGLLHRHVRPGEPPASPDPTSSRLSLLLLGISGGIVPCPSALVVLLSAISLHRVGLGLLLIVAFSAGLALVLVAIGLLMVTCGRVMERLPWNGGLFRRLPVASAAIVCVLGAAVALQSLSSTGAAPRIVISAAAVVPLLFGFVLGMKHALETDHLVAVTTIVTEQGSLLRSAIVGAFWGLGHTSSLFVAAVIVIVLRVRIPDRVAMGLEFTVALMLVGLGLRAVRWWLAHGRAPTPLPEAASPAPVGRRPYLVGLVHGMAGSAALMLVVLTTIPSPWLALGYVLLFGFGSVAGMLMMSVLLSLPLRLTARRLGRMLDHVRLAAGVASTAFGLFLTWQIGFVEGLFR